jgi:hypothetical protein
VLGDTARDVGLDLQGDGDACPYEAGEMGDELLGEAAGVAADASGVEGHRAGAVAWAGVGDLMTCRDSYRRQRIIF